MITAGFHHTACNGSEALLTSRVPDLELDPFIVQHNLLDLEVNPVQIYSISMVWQRLNSIAQQIRDLQQLLYVTIAVRTRWW
jgi:hypothetical protein